MQYLKTLSKLIDSFNSFPGIGPKMAERLSLYILKMSKNDVLTLSDVLKEVKDKVINCSICGSITEQDPCFICKSDRRDKQVICVVQQPQDVWAIERSEYKGKYHVLMGVLSPLDGIGPEDLRIKELLMRLKQENIQEIIVATNPTVEGEATALYLSGLLKPIVPNITRIAHGVPIGADLEYTDEATIAKAIERRSVI